MRRLAFLCLLVLSGALPALGSGPLRVLPLGGPVTETVYALGAGDLVVGTDTSSVYPEAATRLPQVGYQRTLAAEGILSLRPDLVLATDEAGPANVLEQLRTAGVKVVLVPSKHSVAGAQAKVRAIAVALDRESDGNKLADRIAAQADEAQKFLAASPDKPTVLFLYARGASTLNVSGRDTAADAMIALAGARNAVTGYEGYKPLTAEAAVAAAPEYLLMMDRGLGSIGGRDAVFNQPGLALTPAGQHKRVVAMDDLLLLGFGPRTGQAITELARALHPSADRQP